MAAGMDGCSRCGRLTDHPKFPTWKEEMAPGEMWSLFGEKWLTEQADVRLRRTGTHDLLTEEVG